MAAYFIIHVGVDPRYVPPVQVYRFRRQFLSKRVSNVVIAWYTQDRSIKVFVHKT
jgi:hypothetical protein